MKDPKTLLFTSNTLFHISNHQGAAMNFPFAHHYQFFMKSLIRVGVSLLVSGEVICIFACVMLKTIYCRMPFALRAPSYGGVKT